MIEDIKTQLRGDNATIKIAMVSLIYFLINSLCELAFSLNLNTYLSLPSYFPSYIKQFWSILTFPLAQGSFLTTLFNLLFLYLVERFFRTFFSENSFWRFFLYGLLFSGLCFLIVGAFIKTDLILYGISAGGYSVFYATVSYQPKMKMQLLFLPITIDLQLIGLILLIFTCIPLFSDFSHSGIYVGQLFGAIFGYFYMKQYEQGKDWLNFTFLKTLKRSEKPKKAPKDDYEFNAQKKEKNHRIDKILEKIAASGYDSLSKEEKDFLFKHGK